MTISKEKTKDNSGRITPSLDNATVSASTYKQSAESDKDSNNISKQSNKLNNELYKDEDFLVCGDVSRYEITYKQEKGKKEYVKELHFNLKNKMDLLFAPVFYLGPYSIYADCRPFNYEEFKDFETEEEIQFNPDIKPFQKWKGVLSLNENSYRKPEKEEDNEYDYYSWTIDGISQLSIDNRAKIPYSFEITSLNEDLEVANVDDLTVKKHTAYDIWHEPPTISLSDPVHLIILTHGIFSNVGGDMLFIRDKIYERCKLKGENVIIRGYEENIGKSYKGIQYLGDRLAAYIRDIVLIQNKKIYLDKGCPGIREISFISHSLGGCVQSYALAHLHKVSPGLFRANNIKLKHFITMASPLLGTAVEMPSYANAALSLGGLGKTGRDLSLKHKNFFDFSLNDKDNKPVLEITARSPIFKEFSNRTLYANTLNDGIVPLRTSALLYLDWHTLDKLYNLFKANHLNFQEYKKQDSNESEAPIPRMHLSKSQKSHNIDAFNENHTDSFYEDSKENKPNHWYVYKNRKYKRFQTLSGDNSSSESSDTNTLSESDEKIKEIHFQPPPKPSAIIAAANLVFAKLPTQKYIHDLKSRSKDVILHDKVYTPEEIPAAHFVNRSKWKKLLYPNDKKYRKEERIARYWHEGKDWRKVLVVLKGDAHNDIIVRRRFVNLFGAVAVKHLIETHFGLSE